MRPASRCLCGRHTAQLCEMLHVRRWRLRAPHAMARQRRRGGAGDTAPWRCTSAVAALPCASAAVETAVRPARCLLQLALAGSGLGRARAPGGAAWRRARRVNQLGSPSLRCTCWVRLHADAALGAGAFSRHAARPQVAVCCAPRGPSRSGKAGGGSITPFACAAPEALHLRRARCELPASEGRRVCCSAASGAWMAACRCRRRWRLAHARSGASSGG
jgi:hypothetical protein